MNCKSFVLQFLFVVGLVHGTLAQSTYEVSFPFPHAHYIKVNVTFSNLSRDSVDIKMPVWTPGSYMVRDYSRNVESFNAVNVAGQQLKVTKVRKNTWRIYHGISKSVSCEYLVYANELNVRSCFTDYDQAYINGAALFVYTEASRNLPTTVLYHPLPHWSNISCGLPKNDGDQWVRKAVDYDELIDAPVVIGNHTVFSFDYNNIPHHIAMVGEAKYDSVRIKKDFYKIVDAATRIFGENPNKDYTFLIHNTQSGGGGLEHRNSASIMTARNNYETEDGYTNLLSLVAHEYFHLWMVKRVRPLELGPFDYDNEVYTRQLWFFEGFTSYYDDYIVHRCGFTSEAKYLEILKNNIQTLLNTPGDKIQPVSDASFDAWIKYYRQNENSRNSTVSYYTRGSLLAVVFSLDFLNSSKGKQSLDTLMSFLYNEHYKLLNRGVTDNELQEYFEIFGNKDYDDFFKKYINGTETIPFEDYLAMAGLKLNRTDGMKQPKGYLGAALTPAGNRLIITQVDRDGPAWTNGLSVNDEITSIDNHSSDKIMDYLAEKEPGSKVRIKFNRAGLPRDMYITLGEPVQKEYAIEIIEKPTELQQKVREQWLGK